MEQRIVYQLNKTDFEKVVAEKLEHLQKETILARYRDRLVSVATVAEIHGVHRDTVIKYAKLDLIPYKRDGKIYQFSLADALQFDFKELRKVA